MSTARTKFVLWLGAAGMTAGAALSLAAAFVIPLDAPPDSLAIDTRAAAAAARRAATQAAAAEPLESFEAAWELDLRRPLVDAPPTVPPGVALQTAIRAAARPPVRLVGTVVGGGRTRALFLTAAGKVEVRGAGEKVGAADVVRVEQNAATLSYAGNTVRLNVERVELPATVPARPAPAFPSPPAGGGS